MQSFEEPVQPVVSEPGAHRTPHRILLQVQAVTNTAGTWECAPATYIRIPHRSANHLPMAHSNADSAADDPAHQAVYKLDFPAAAGALALPKVPGSPAAAPVQVAAAAGDATLVAASAAASAAATIAASAAASAASAAASVAALAVELVVASFAVATPAAVAIAVARLVILPVGEPRYCHQTEAHRIPNPQMAGQNLPNWQLLSLVPLVPLVSLVPLVPLVPSVQLLQNPTANQPDSALDS